MTVICSAVCHISVDFIAMLSYDLKTIRNKLYNIKNDSLNNLLRYDSNDNNSLQEYKNKDKN